MMEANEQAGADAGRDDPVGSAYRRYLAALRAHREKQAAPAESARQLDELALAGRENPARGGMMDGL